MKPIPYGRQHIEKDDISAVVGVLRSDWMTQGPSVGKLERSLADYCGAKYAVAVSSGTAALHIACLSAGLKKGDEAITTPITFLATPNSVLYAGAKPVFADIEYETMNMDPEEMRKKITKKTKAVLPVHFAGLPCDMLAISRIAKRNGLMVIEDACHALGAEYKSGGKWNKVGSCRHSDMTVFSFHPVKHITTGEGGAVTTNNKNLYRKLLALRSHGVYKTPDIMRKKGPWYYEMRDLGFNYRITDIQCALGKSQLKKIKEFLKKRRRIAEKYKRYFQDMEDVIELPGDFNAAKKHAWHLFVLRLKLDNLKKGRKYIFNRISKKGIGIQVHYIPVYRQPYYRKAKKSFSEYPGSEEYYKGCISIPIYPGLDDRKVKKVADTVRKCVLPLRRNKSAKA